MANVGSNVPTVERPTVFVLLGASGDLAKRMILPGIYHLFRAGLLPENFALIGSAPAEQNFDTPSFRSHMRDAVATFGRRELDEKLWARLSPSVSFASFDQSDPAPLLDAVNAAKRQWPSPAQVLFYLAIPPPAFPGVVQLMGKTGLADGAKLIIEKPFGHDLESALALNAALGSVFAEDQIYRIDHFLGKEAVQNILAVRFANGIFEPAWNHRHLDYIQIDIPEELTVSDRGAFYEATGALRDMIVTHLFQLLGFLAMEMPADFGPASLNEARLAVFEAMRPVTKQDCVFGQYGGYRGEPGVAPESQVETLAALRVHIDNDRWQGVPFFLRTGKAMAATSSTVTLGFKTPAHQLFPPPSGAPANLDPNELVLELTDPGSIRLDFTAKEPGPTMTLGLASMGFDYQSSFNSTADLKAYERLLHDVMLGDHTLFNGAQGIERLWEVVAPVLADPPAVQPYDSGSWGPDALDTLVAPWRWNLGERLR